MFRARRRWVPLLPYESPRNKIHRTQGTIMKHKYSVLVIDDQDNWRELLMEILSFTLIFRYNRFQRAGAVPMTVVPKRCTADRGRGLPSGAPKVVVAQSRDIPHCPHTGTMSNSHIRPQPVAYLFSRPDVQGFALL